MKYICNKVKSGHCKNTLALSGCIHATPHDCDNNCTEEDDCFRYGKDEKVKCVKIMNKYKSSNAQPE